MPKIIEYPDELTHYGRLGMKWGQHIFGKEQDRRRPTRQEKKDYFGKLNMKKRLRRADDFFHPYYVSDKGDAYNEKTVKPLYEKSVKHISKLLKNKKPSALLAELKKDNWNERTYDEYDQVLTKLNNYISEHAPKDTKSYYIADVFSEKRMMERVTLGGVYASVWSDIVSEGSRGYWDELLDFNNPRIAKYLMEEAINGGAAYYTKGG